ncbi:hypothetical protein OPKNFCMD_6528 [Methylobacterium crusticola]|uniref:ABC transporter substrate-binding protein n=1 Tax=Methylobacterium crusticola TaxID=1697972 RepID=A0ABQ4R9A4_9HYPH|nr:ABC transporter substrate-binding protein [Methylobacterium crusticola]GJD53750.1 hypothetical protein OPKNFCMD_6528 [Methylobacterium crusticola]
MRRRAVLLGLGAGLAAARARAENGPVRRIAVLSGGGRADDADSLARVAALKEELAELGWTEGRNLRFDLEWTDGRAERIEAAARRVVERRPDVIVTSSTPAAIALARATRTIPVVMATIVDPVGLGIVASLARPGANLTGFTLVDLDLLPKWPDVLREVAPGLARAALIYNPQTTPFYPEVMRKLAPSSRDGVPMHLVAIERPEEIEAVVARIAAAPGTGLVMLPNPLLNAERRRIAAATGRLRVPSISVFRDYAAQGGLMAYGPDILAIYRRAAEYVDRILRGAEPGSLPVQSPLRYELAINLRVASALGLTVSSSLLGRADEVIE